MRLRDSPRVGREITRVDENSQKADGLHFYSPSDRGHDRKSLVSSLDATRGCVSEGRLL